MKPVYIAIFMSLFAVFMSLIAVYAGVQAKKRKGEG